MMTTSIRRFLFASCYLACASSSAQNLEKVPKVTPMQPEAASIFKVLDRPIGTSTGTIAVGFPLFSLSSGKLSANVSINYNSTGGIKVEEIASSVGLGFSLSDGAGRITQMVKDLPDDSQKGYLNYSMKPSLFNCSDMNQVGANYHSDSYDLEPDIYLYNINGRSGKFFIKENGTVVVMGNEPITVQYVMGPAPGYRIVKWIITDENGSKYYIGQSKDGSVSYKVTNNYSHRGNFSTVATVGVSSSSWYLTEAFDMNEENRIKYSYVLSNGTFETFSGAFKILLQSGSCLGYNTNSDQAMTITEGGEYIVSRIEADNGYLVFNSSFGRQDGVNRRKIDNIQLYNLNNSLQKEIKLNYAYFNPGSNDVLVRRLKLENFSEFGVSTTDSLTHRFEYEESVNLPSRHSFATDFWGFYNRPYSGSPFPSVVFKWGDYTIRQANSDKNADPNYGKANILKKVIYPTGGYRQFIYEGNTALSAFDPNLYYPDQQYTNNNGFFETSFSSAPIGTPCLKKTFTINSADGGTQFSYSLIETPSSCSNYKIRIYKTVNAGDLTGGAQIKEFLNLSDVDFNLDNGYYRLEFYKNTGCTFNGLSAQWDECTLTTSSVMTPSGSYTRDVRRVGGVRIKEIKDYDPVSGNSNSTNYYYNLYSTDSTLTSGLLASQVNLVSIEGTSGVDCSYWKLSPESQYPLASENGSYVCYTEVRTVQSGNGWTDHVYLFTPDDPPWDYPYGPPTDNSMYRNKLLQEKVYSQSHSLLKKTSNTYYIEIEGKRQVGKKAIGYYYDGLHDPNWYDYPYLPGLLPVKSDCSEYYLAGLPMVLTSTTEVTYAGVDSCTTKTTYQHANFNDFLLVKQKQTTINSNKNIKENYKYPFDNVSDFTFGLTANEQAMKLTLLNANWLQPLETTRSITSGGGAPVLQSGVKSVFSNFNSNKIHLADLVEYTSPTVYKETILSAYDAKGNLLEHYTPGGAKEVYLWGYNGTSLVAKIVGSAYTTVNAFVNFSILNNPASDDALRTHLSDIRASLAYTPAQVNSYTYSPLKGITSSTDARGLMTSYQYDNFLRLKTIKDFNGNVIKSFQYHYKP